MLLNLVKKAKNRLEKLENKLFERKLRQIAGVQNFELGSSITASAGYLYPHFCELAATDDAVYATFRKHPIYTQVLEHVNCQHGVAYLQCCEDAFSTAEFKDFARNDATGGGGLPYRA